MFGRIAMPARGCTPFLAALLLTMIPCGAVRAGLSVEPEIGVRTFTGPLADVFDPGISIGAVVGISNTPRLRMLGHVDLSLHPASGDTSYQVERGVAIGMTVGGRFLPLGEDASRAVQPYLGAEAGFTVLNWSLKDGYVYNPDHSFENLEGIHAFTLGGEAGVTIRTASGLALGLAARLRHHSWSSGGGNYFFSVGGAPGFKGNEFGVSARLSLPFDD